MRVGRGLPPLLELSRQHGDELSVQPVAEGARRLLLFGFGALEDMLAKGNLEYVRHYERYFDVVDVAYLRGHSPQTHTLGRTRCWSLGGRLGSLTDLALAPLRLYRLAKVINPTSYLTADIVFCWWTACLLRAGGARVVLMPVSLPESVYATNRSMHGVPIWFERALIRLSFICAARIIVPANGEAQRRWLMSDRFSRRKTVVTAATVEEYPPADFYASASGLAPEPPSDVPVLLYVGRLHPEKKAGDLIEAVAILRDRGIDAQLCLVGDGKDRSRMEARVQELGLAHRVTFRGALPHAALVPLYRSATLFVSTVTGTALREAGLLGVPIVAYAIDWVPDLLRDGETALLARAGDPVDLAEAIARALRDPVLRASIGEAFCQEAHARWPLSNIAIGLRDAFAEDDVAIA